MSVSKERLDIVLVKKGLVESREKAKRIILSGVVFVNHQRVEKAGALVDPDDEIIVKDNPIPFVSRGGLKLQKALEVFNIDVSGKIFMDVGASTGGFTHCLLKNGAAKVYAIDVGYGQLAWQLRQDPRVVVMERTNIRYVKPNDLEEVPQGATVDVSFISLKVVLPVIKEIIEHGSDIVSLIKPQFEAGREKIGKKGVVRSSNIHEEVLLDVLTYCQSMGLDVLGLTFSPITGPKGNIEFLAHLNSGVGEPKNLNMHELVSKVVKKAHDDLRK